MSKTLLIVESPAKVKTISKFLGKQYIVKASMGHLRDLPKSQVGVDVNAGFAPKYITIRGKGDLIKDLKDAAKKSDKILLATDPDREGEAIAWHLAHILGMENSKSCRISFNEITSSAVKSAINKPRKLDNDLIDAQQARRVLDRLVGYNLSPLLWRKVHRGLSAGRVQSSALKIICDREREIKAFVTEEYWSLDALLKSKKGSSLKASLVIAKKSPISNEALMQKVIKSLEGARYIVKDVVKKEKKKNPSPPFTTSTLQQEAFRKLSYNAKKTMQTAQQLYEGVDVKGKGHIAFITYMRTDSVRISKEAQDQALKYIDDVYGKKYLPESPRFYKGRSKAQDAHEAIRPVDVFMTPQKALGLLGRDQARLYKLIWERFMSSQMASAILDTVTIDINAGAHDFKANGSITKFDGFTSIYLEGVDDDKKEKDQKLPDIAINEELNLDKLQPEQHFTQPPPRYSEATLVKTLEENGIGRPSTYAPILETLRKRDYATVEEKRFIPTETGFVVYDLLKEYFPTIVDLEFTANMENELDEVEDGKRNWTSLMESFYTPFSELLSVADKAIEKIVIQDEVIEETCPKCGKNLVIKNGRFGKFIACPNYPECKYTRSIVNTLDAFCPKCGKNIIQRKSKKGRNFYGCSGYPDCDFTMWNMPSKVLCEKCGSITTEKKLKSGTTYKCANEKCLHEWKKEVKKPAGGKKLGK